MSLPTVKQRQLNTPQSIQKSKYLGNTEESQRRLEGRHSTLMILKEKDK